ncbi:hypothetical protein [Bdellovibrio bacteriovorus]|uniref:hypothetical protein n=1 Tax=Bdellovibrio bacteriovorus TaxID=959 RepID=UPI0005A28990|nr:hypothetical protein [Bdellovibrio bacteriovorus]
MNQTAAKKVLMALASLFLVTSQAHAVTTQDGRQIKLNMNDPVLVNKDFSLPRRGVITDIRYQNGSNTRLLYSVNGVPTHGTEIFAIGSGTCLKGKAQTLCVGDLVEEDLIDSGPAETTVIGIQVQASGIFKKSNAILIQRDNEIVQQLIDNLRLLESAN